MSQLASIVFEYSQIQTTPKITSNQFAHKICTSNVSDIVLKPNGVSHSYQLDQSISVEKGCWMVFFIFIQILIVHSVSKQWRPWSDAAFVASDPGLRCLPMSHKKDEGLIRVNWMIKISDDIKACTITQHEKNDL